MDTNELVTTATDGAVQVITLNRPEARNALSVALQSALAVALHAADKDETVACVVLTGADPAFCAGLDLKELGRGVAPGTLSQADSPFTALTQMHTPTIGAINGACATGGLELALACDFLVASESARFGDTHARVGFTPAGGMSVLLPQAVGLRMAREMSFTGNFIDAATAEQWGIVNHVYAPDDLVPRAIELATDIASADSRAVRGMKRLYDTGGDGTFADGLRTELAHTREHMSAVTPADIEARRQAVMARGRQQSS